MPTPNKYGRGPSILEYYNVEGTVERTGTSVVMVIKPASANVELKLHFSDPTQMMNFFVLMIEEMALVFPSFEASKLWKDDTFK